MNDRKSVILKYVVVVLACALFKPAYGDDQSQPHFRNVRWYDTIDVVRKKETSPFVEYRHEELNIAVDPPKPWKVEHLYYKDALLGRPVLILYRFDLNCKQLYEGGYIFDEILDDRAIYQLVAAIEDKYKIKLNTEFINEELFSGGKLNEDTSVQINQGGRLHFHSDKSVIYYQTNNFHWLGGWKEGTEPTCREKDSELERLQEKL